MRELMLYMDSFVNETYGQRMNEIRMKTSVSKVSSPPAQEADRAMKMGAEHDGTPKSRALALRNGSTSQVLRGKS